jgi:hypothetical protein
MNPNVRFGLSTADPLHHSSSRAAIGVKRTKNQPGTAILKDRSRPTADIAAAIYGYGSRVR